MAHRLAGLSRFLPGSSHQDVSKPDASKQDANKPRTNPETLNRFRQIPRLFCILMAVWLLSGCVTLSDPEASQEDTRDLIGQDAAWQGNGFIGQTFVSRRAALNGITLWVSRAAPEGAASAQVTVELHPSLQAALSGQVPLYTNSIPVVSSQSIYVAWPPRPDPPGTAYFILLRSSDPALQAQGRLSDPYAGGQAYANDQPVEGDLAFRIYYDYDTQSVWADLQRFVPDAWLLPALSLLLFLPGWLLLDLAGLRRHFDLLEQAALSLGLSLALIPLLMLWTSRIGLRWGRPAVLLAVLLLIAAAVWRLLRLRTQPGLYPPARSTYLLIALLTVPFSLTFFARMAMVRDLSAPAWVDSVHHALITRLIVEDGGFPTTYAPYLNLDAARYHAGFHSSLAAFEWLTGMEPSKALLFYGQALNALAVLAVYLLAVTLTQNRVAAAAAGTIAGLFTPMPAYYASWGRYTQLAGLLILPCVLALARLYLLSRLPVAPPPEPAQPQPEGEAPQPEPAPAPALPPLTLRESRAALVLAAVASGGLLLVHYRAAVFAGLLVVAYFISQVSWNRTQVRPLLKNALLASLASLALAGGAALLTLPWVLSNLARLVELLALPPTKSTGAQVQFFSDFSWRFLNAGLGKYTLVLAGAGLAWALLRRRSLAVVLILWFAALFFLANLGAIGLPGEWFINNTSVAITLFMPIAVLGGYLVEQVFFSWLPRLPRRAAAVYLGILGLVILALCIYGIRQLLPILNSTTLLFREDDRPAIAWVEKNVPPGETVLINPFSWGYGLCAGSDGGYWIAPLAGRATLPPPVIYGFGEATSLLEVNAACSEVIQKGADPSALWDILDAQGIHYVYTGVRGGPISAAALSQSDLFEVVYNENGAWVFKKVENRVFLKSISQPHPSLGAGR